MTTSIADISEAITGLGDTAIRLKRERGVLIASVDDIFLMACYGLEENPDAAPAMLKAIAKKCHETLGKLAGIQAGVKTTQ